jgi:hypothetical protein
MSSSYCTFLATPVAPFDGIAPMSALLSIAGLCILRGMELRGMVTGSPQCVIPAVAALCALPPPEPPFPLPPPCANAAAEPHKNATDTPANTAFRNTLLMVFSIGATAGLRRVKAIYGVGRALDAWQTELKMKKSAAAQ